MKYILVGGSGFIGQHFIKKLGNNIILNIDIDGGINSTEFNNCNILDLKKLLNIKINCNDDVTLIHLAAVHFDFQKNYFETNVEGTKNILKFLENNYNIVKYVFFSSVATYGKSQNGKNEKSLQKPLNNYGKSKLEAEKLILNWKKKNKKIQIIIVRPCVVFGEYNFGNVYNLIKQINSNFFAVIGDGKNFKSIAYVKNLVDSVVFCINKVNDPIFIYNYCDYPQLNVLDQSRLISNILDKKKLTKIPLWIANILVIPFDILQYILKIDLKINSVRIKKFNLTTLFYSDKIRSRGFKQKHSTNESLKNTINWINNSNINHLRKNWYKKASKL